MLTADQRYIRKMALLGLLTAAFVIVCAWWVSSVFYFQVHNDLSVRCNVYVWTLIISIVPMLVLIARIANERFFGKAIEGDHSDPIVEIDVKVLNNTHEQFLLFAIASLGLVISLPMTKIVMPVILAIAFNIYRFFFWMGYHKTPIMRAYGFAATFYSNIFVFIFSVLLMTDLV